MFSSPQQSFGRHETPHSLFDLIWILSGLTTCVRDRPCFTAFRKQIEQNSCVIGKFSAILGYWRFMQIRQRIFNCTNMQIMHFILDNFWNFWHITRLSVISRRKVMWSQMEMCSFLGHPGICDNQQKVFLSQSTCLVRVWRFAIQTGRSFSHYSIFFHLLPYIFGLPFWQRPFMPSWYIDI